MPQSGNCAIKQKICKRIQKKVNEIVPDKKVRDTEYLVVRGAASSDILIADDNKIHVKIFERYLNKLDFPFRISNNGYEAIGELLKSRPGLILLDINMPIIDGLDTIKIIKKNSKWRHIPVIVVSSISFEEKIVEIIRMGADDYILKPFEQKIFIEKFRALYKHDRQNKQKVSLKLKH